MAKDLEKLRARYRLRFIEGAKQRVDRSLELMLTQTKANAAVISEELRNLAGEAALLGLDSMASVARAGADSAKLWEEQSSEAAVRVCEHSLHTLAETIELLAAMTTGDFTEAAEQAIAGSSDAPADAADQRTVNKRV